MAHELRNLVAVIREAPSTSGAWYNFEPAYYRAYQKLKHNVFY